MILVPRVSQHSPVSGVDSSEITSDPTSSKELTIKDISNNYSAVTGLITFFISSIRLAGKPPLSACSLMISLLGAL